MSDTQRRIQKPVQITMPPQLTEALDRQAEREGVNGRSTLLRKAAYIYLSERMRERGEDPTGMLQELIR